MSNLYDVIIIGAGLSGLTAAQTILEKEPNVDIVILEAKGRIGGRILSVPVKVKNNKICLFDIGAHWLSSTQNHLERYLKLFDLTLVPQKTGPIIGILNNSVEKFNLHPVLGNIFNVYEIKNFFATLDEQSEFYKFSTMNHTFFVDFYDTITMEHFINSKMYTQTAKNIAKSIVQTTCGLKASEVSVLYYLFLCNSCLGFTNQYLTIDGGAREFWIEEGAQEICNGLKEIIGEHNIYLTEPVIEMNSSRRHEIRLKTLSGKKYICTHVICAIPPGEILKIKMEPALNGFRRQALEKIQMGHLIKFIVTYKTPFWNIQDCSGEIFSCNKNSPIVLCHDATIKNIPALTGYIKYPNNLIPELDGTYRRYVIEQLATFWGGEALEPIDYVEKSWCDEPYIGGCPMSCPALETVKWYYSLSQPNGSIYFAGSDLATEWNGYMEGAVQSGYKAAINFLYDHRPQVLTYHDIIYIDTKHTHKIRFAHSHFINRYTVVIGAIFSYFLYKLIIKSK